MKLAIIISKVILFGVIYGALSGAISFFVLNILLNQQPATDTLTTSFYVCMMGAIGGGFIGGIAGLINSPWVTLFSGIFLKKDWMLDCKKIYIAIIFVGCLSVNISFVAYLLYEISHEVDLTVMVICNIPTLFATSAATYHFSRICCR